MQGLRKQKNGQYMWVCHEGKCFFYGFADSRENADQELQKKREELSHRNLSLEIEIRESRDTKVQNSKEYSEEGRTNADWDGETVTEIGKKDCTVTDFFPLYMSQKSGLRDTTIFKYKQLFKGFIEPGIGHRKIAAITPQDLEKYLITLTYSETSPITIGVVKMLLAGIFRSAKKNCIIETNPMNEVEIPRNKRKAKERTPFREEELEELFQQLAESEYLPMVKLGAWTGMRIGEILGLQREDIDFQRACIYVRHTLRLLDNAFSLQPPKTEAGRRTIPVSEECLRMLQDEIAKREEEKLWNNQQFVFLSKCNRPVYAQAVNRQLQICVRRMKQEGKLEQDGNYTFHSLRHTFASRCLMKGMKPKVLAKILGHSSTKVTLGIYTHICEDDTREEMRRAGML